MRLMRKQPSGFYNPWNQSAEVGDRFVCSQTKRVYDIRESHGRNKAAMGELTPVLASASKKGLIPFLFGGSWYWATQNEVEQRRTTGKAVPRVRGRR
jgi:hypothetical protein